MQQIATLRQSTQIHYTALLDHIQQHFGGREIESLTSEDVGRFLEMLNMVRMSFCLS
jgi:hypothetical protein